METDNENPAISAPTDYHPSAARSHLLTRLMASNESALSDAELLEIILNPIASAPHLLSIRLLERFVSLNKIIYAEEHEIRTVDGVTDGVVHALLGVRLLGQRVLKSRIGEQSVIDSWMALMDYCNLTMANNKVEEFRVLFLNGRNALIADELMHRGTLNHIVVYPREIVKRGLELSAAAVVLLHNHTSGDPSPSKADIDVTRKIVEAASTVNITVHDHVIISESGHYSFKTAGLIEAVPDVQTVPTGEK